MLTWAFLWILRKTTHHLDMTAHRTTGRLAATPTQISSARWMPKCSTPPCCPARAMPGSAVAHGVCVDAPELTAGWVSGALTQVSPMSGEVKKPARHG